MEQQGLTDHFSFQDAAFSPTGARFGIDNTPPDDMLPVLLDTAQRMEEVRHMLGDKPVVVHSWYRSAAVNALVGGVPDSAHRTGYAVDFVCPPWVNIEACQTILNHGVPFNQLILEYGWIHIDFSPTFKGQVLTKQSSTTPYLTGLVA